MKFIKTKMVYNGSKTNKVEDKSYTTLYFINDEGDNEGLNYTGNVDELNVLKNGDFINIHCKIHKAKDNYYKVVGVSIFKIEKM